MSTRKGPLTGCSIMTSSWYRRIFPNRLAAHRAREERLTTRRVAGIAISFAGVVLVIAKGTSALVHELSFSSTTIVSPVLKPVFIRYR
jgi:hypothetical protein